MLGKIRCLIKATPLKVLPVIVAVFLMASVVNVYIYKVEHDRLVQFNEEMEQQHKEESWDDVSSLIKMANAASRQNSKYIAKKIEVDILREYSNLDILKTDFSNGQFSQDFHKILKTNLVSQNGAPSALYPPAYYTIVGMEKGVIAIFSNEASATLTASSTDSIIAWDAYEVSRPNPELTSQAIDAVMNRDPGIIFWQNTLLDNVALDNGGKMGLDMLRQVYEAEGLEGLGSYSIISPSYITEHGDVFETDDTTLLRKNDNYKLVILQSFNLLDVLGKYEVELEASKYNSESNIRFVDDYMKYSFVKTIGGSLVLFILSLFFVNIYNSAFRTKERRRS